MMDPPEFPECPVCLQPFDGDSTIPRVLACGHSTCQTCLVELPKPIPCTIRCPACTQLVNYPPHPQGPSALPKNIDLLRISSLLLNNPNHHNNIYSPKPSKVLPNQQLSKDFIPSLCSHEFYSNWKDWVVPKDALLVESSVVDDDGSCLYGRVIEFKSPTRCLLKENHKVSLLKLKVGSFSQENDSSKFNYSYVAKVMWVLCGMSDGELAELGLILRASLNGHRICKAYGLWYNEDNKGVYLVCERYNLSFLNDWKYSGIEEEKTNSGIEDDISGFAMIGMELCESVSGLHKSGLITGCLALSCFDVDDFGHAFIDLNEVLVLCGRVQRIIAKTVSHTRKNDEKESEMSLKEEISETCAFVSPELLLEFLQKECIDHGCGSMRYVVGYDSDIWALACILLWLLAGKPFVVETSKIQCGLILSAIHGSGSDFNGLYMDWLEKVSTLLDTRLGVEFVVLKEFLCKCLNFDPKRRPLVTDLWRCIRELIIKPKFDAILRLEQKITNENKDHFLLLGELCQLLNRTNKVSGLTTDGLKEEDENGRTDSDKVEEMMVKRDLIKGLSEGPLKCIDLKGHLDCITGFAIGGGFLFSSSFDKTVNVWSLQDFTHVHSFKGHEHKVMAIVFVDEEQPLCISGDSGGAICIWGIRVPFDKEPIKRLHEEKDWRYSGIHALSVSGTGYFYTGSGDKSIKAWSMQDYTLSCTMTGHKSVVSTLAVCNGVLYSGSWDGTIRLWCLSDHSPLAVLGEDAPGSLICGSVLALAADSHTLVAAHENGSIKIWSNDVLLKSISAHIGAIFTASMEGKWLFTGGWNKTVIVQELSGSESEVDVKQIGTIAGDSVITALLYWQGKLFIGQADRVIKVYHCGV